MLDAFKKGLVQFPDEPTEGTVFSEPVKKEQFTAKPEEDREHPITLAEHCRRIASLGGRARSEAKAAAARENAQKPRPKARERNALRRAQKNLTNN